MDRTRFSLSISMQGITEKVPLCKYQVMISTVENNKHGKQKESVVEGRLLLLIQNVRECLLMRNKGARPVGSPGESDSGK